MRGKGLGTAFVALAAAVMAMSTLAGCSSDEKAAPKDVSVAKLAELTPGLKKAGFECEKPGKPSDDNEFGIGGEEPVETVACSRDKLEYEVARWRSAAVADEAIGAALVFVCGFGAGQFDYVDGGNWIGAVNSSNTDDKAKKAKQAAALQAAAGAAGIEVTKHKCASKANDDPFSTGDDDEDKPTGPGTSRSDALEVGTSMKVGEYDVTVTEIEPDATDALEADSDYFNEPKGQYMLVELEVTFEGDDEGQPGFDLDVVLSGSDRIQYDECQVTLKDDDVPTIEPGGKITYHQCIDAPPEAIDGGVVLVKGSFGDDRGYWKIPA